MCGTESWSPEAHVPMSGTPKKSRNPESLDMNLVALKFPCLSYFSTALSVACSIWISHRCGEKKKKKKGLFILWGKCSDILDLRMYIFTLLMHILLSFLPTPLPTHTWMLQIQPTALKPKTRVFTGILDAGWTEPKEFNKYNNFLLNENLCHAIVVNRYLWTSEAQYIHQKILSC